MVEQRRHRTLAVGAGDRHERGLRRVGEQLDVRDHFDTGVARSPDDRVALGKTRRRDDAPDPFRQCRAAEEQPRLGPDFPEVLDAWRFGARIVEDRVRVVCAQVARNG